MPQTNSQSAHPALAGIPLVLGGNVFGWTINADQSFAVLDAFYEAGGRMIDSAEIYSAWIPGNKGGESETIIGQWLASRGVRAEMRIGTKTGLGAGKELLAPAKVAAALQGSLDRLRTDYIDLYYAHRDQPDTPLDEVVAGFAALVTAGHVRSLGASNFTPERFAASLASAHQQGVTGYSVLQPGYNLVWRGEYPVALQDLAVANGVAVLPYYSLGAGFLTGKYRSPEDFTTARGSSAEMFTKTGWQALPVLDEVAAEPGATPAQVALAWLRSRPAIHAPVASGTTPAHVADLAASAKLVLNAEQLAKLTAVSVDREL